MDKCTEKGERLEETKKELEAELLYKHIQATTQLMFLQLVHIGCLG